MVVRQTTIHCHGPLIDLLRTESHTVKSWQSPFNRTLHSGWLLKQFTDMLTFDQLTRLGHILQFRKDRNAQRTHLTQVVTASRQSARP